MYQAWLSVRPVVVRSDLPLNLSPVVWPLTIDQPQIQYVLPFLSGLGLTVTFSSFTLYWSSSTRVKPVPSALLTTRAVALSSFGIFPPESVVSGFSDRESTT